MITLTSTLPLAAAPGSSPSKPFAFLHKHCSQVPDSAVLPAAGRDEAGSSGQRAGSLQMLQQGNPPAGSDTLRRVTALSHTTFTASVVVRVAQRGEADSTEVDSSLSSRASPQRPLLDISHAQERPWKPRGGLGIKQ